jgi:hypothetical protein
MNDSRASQVRFLKYLLPVISLSVLFNIPKFFEAEISFDENQLNSTEIQLPTIDITSLRKNPDYAIYYHNWARLAVLGIVPFVMLVYFNTKIYNDLQVSSSLFCLIYYSDSQPGVRQLLAVGMRLFISTQNKPILVLSLIKMKIKLYCERLNSRQNKQILVLHQLNLI